MLIFNKNILFTVALLSSLGAASIYSMNIIEAARNGFNRRILALIAAGADVNQQDVHGRTALIEAANNGHQVVAKTLIEHGANVNLSDNEGRTPLQEAVNWHCLAIIHMLIAAGATVNQQDKYGWTPLHCAARFADPEVAQILIAHGATINQPDNAGGTPLHWALELRRQDIVNLINRVNEVSVVANRQLLALLSAAHPRLCALPSVRSVFQDTQTNGLAHMIGKFVRQAAYEDALYHQPEPQQPHRERKGCIIS